MQQAHCEAGARPSVGCLQGAPHHSGGHAVWGRGLMCCALPAGRSPPRRRALAVLRGPVPGGRPAARPVPPIPDSAQPERHPGAPRQRGEPHTALTLPLQCGPQPLPGWLLPSIVRRGFLKISCQMGEQCAGLAYCSPNVQMCKFPNMPASSLQPERTHGLRDGP